MSSIKEILLELGPYLEHEFLADFTEAEWTRRNLSLTNVKMETLRGQPTGLDETEVLDPTSDETNLSSDAHSFNFAGILKVEKQEWISALGQEKLKADYLQRAKQTLKLEYIFARHSASISICILCRCSGKLANRIDDAGMLTLRSDRDHLQNVRRISLLFKIPSLHVISMSKSARYLEQWRLYRFVRETCKDMTKSQREAVTIEWLVEEYKKTTRTPASGSQAAHPRHISRAEIRKHFLDHAEFLLAQQLVTSAAQHRFMNLAQLVEFCNNAPKERRALAIARGDRPAREGPLVERLCQAHLGGTAEKWRRRLQNIQNKQDRPVAPKPRLKRPTASAPRTSHVIAGEGYESSESEAEEEPEDDIDTEDEYDKLDLLDLGPGNWDIFTHLVEHAAPDVIQKLRSTIRMDLSIAEWPCPLCSFKIDMRAIKTQCSKQFANEHNPDGRKELVFIAQRFFAQAWTHRGDHWKEYGIRSEVVHGEHRTRACTPVPLEE